MSKAVGSKSIGVAARAAFVLALGAMMAAFLCVGCGAVQYSDGNGGDGTAYTVTFSANGGSGTPPAARTVDAGDGVSLPGQGNLTRSGYTFGGWNTSGSGAGTNYSAGASYTPTGNVTLYAKWNSDGGGGNLDSRLFNAANEAWVACDYDLDYEDVYCEGVVLNSNGTFYGIGMSSTGDWEIEASGTYSTSGSTLTVKLTNGEENTILTLYRVIL